MMEVWECLVRNQLLQKVGGKQLLLAKNKDAHQFKSSGGSAVLLSTGNMEEVWCFESMCHTLLFYINHHGEECAPPRTAWVILRGQKCCTGFGSLCYLVFTFSLHSTPHPQHDTQFMRTIVGHAALQ